MDEHLRSEKRAEFMDEKTTLKQRWVAALILFVAVLVVLFLISLL